MSNRVLVRQLHGDAVCAHTGKRTIILRMAFCIATFSGRLTGSHPAK